MKTEHTLGKWMVAVIGKTSEGKDKFQIVADIPYDGPMGGDTETPLCDIFQFGSHKEAEANAQLIAAAPELLEACRIALRCSGLLDPRFQEHFKTIKEAIKKAKTEK